MYTVRHTDIHVDIHTNRHTDTHTQIDTERHAYRQTDNGSRSSAVGLSLKQNSEICFPVALNLRSFSGAARCLKTGGIQKTKAVLNRYTLLNEN